VAITYEASGSTSITSASSSWSFTPDAGTIAGDVFVVQVFTQDADANITVPLGSIAIAVNNDDLQSPAGGNRVSVFAWLAGWDAPGPQTVGVSAAAEGTITWARFRGVDAFNPFDAFQYVSDGGGSAVSDFSTPAVTTTVADCYILAGLCIDAGSSTPTLSGPSGSWTNLFPTVSPRKGAMALKGVQSSPGSSGAVTGWGSSEGGTADAPRVGWQAALRPRIGPYLRSTQTYGSVGLIDTNANPPTLPAPALLAEGDLLLVAAFFAQGIATAGEQPVPDGMVRLTDIPVPTTGDTRRGVVFGAVVEDPADFAGGIELRSPATATRIAAVALAYQPSEGKRLDLDALSVPTPTWHTSNLTDIPFPAGATGDLVLGVVMTNKSASLTYTSHTPVGGGMLIRSTRAVNGTTGSQADSVVSVTQGGTGVTFNLPQANGIGMSIGITEVDGDDPEPSGIWFETDFTGGAPGTEATTATEPEVDIFTYPMVYASVPNTPFQGVRPRTDGYSEARILTEGRTKWRAGIRLYFESSTTATGYYYAIGARIGSTLSFDTGLRGNSTTGNRHGSTRNNFTYVGETLPNVIQAGEIWSYELLYDEGDVTVMIWDHGLASSPALDLSTQRAPDYTWTYTSALETPTDWYFGPSGATGVSAILFDAWATEGERREGPEPDPAVTHWAHNGSSRHDRFLVAARVEDAESVAIEYSTSPDFAGGTTSAAVTEPLTPDGHYRLEATGLTPATTYYWRLVVNGSPTGQTGRTKTLAAPGGPADMRIVWGSCYWSNASAVFPLIGAHDPDLIVQVGDDGYTFYSAGETNPNPGQPYPAPADTALIRSIRDEVFTRVGRATMTTAFPVEHMYSDCDGLGGNMDSTEGAPENVQEAWRQMYAHYLDHADTGFRTWVSGRVRFIVVDENTASDAKNSPQSPTKSKLGAAQKALLFAALDQAAADGHFVVLFGDGPWYGARDNSLSSTGIGYNKYDDERTEIGQKVQQCIADGMLGFHRYHGDDHTLYGDSGANNAWGGFPVYCAAPMNETSNTGTIATYDAGKWPTTPAEAGSARQYGVIDITDDGVTITVRTRGFSSTPSEPTEVVRYDQTLTYAEPPAEVSASGSIERGGLAVVEQPVVPPAEVSASASIVRSGAAVVDSPAIPPAEVEASTGVTRGGLAVLEAPSVPPAEVSASTALVRSGVATVAAPTVPPSQVQATASLSRGGVATVATPTVPPAEVQAAASLSRSGVATVVTTDVPPSQVQALTMRLLAGLAIISSAPVPPAEVQAAGSIVRGGVARISNGQRVPILDPVIGPYRRRTLIDPVET